MWTVEGNACPASHQHLVGSNMGKIVTVVLPGCRMNYPGCEVTVKVIKTVDGKPCSSFHRFTHYRAGFSGM